MQAIDVVPCAPAAARSRSGHRPAKLRRCPSGERRLRRASHRCSREALAAKRRAAPRKSKQAKKSKKSKKTKKTTTPESSTASLLSELPKLPPELSRLSAAALRLLVGTFPVPPFLLPIYQAAGIEYGIPWQVLAAINQVETDFGRDLNTSSAGAEGWMQFLPSTWVRFAVDADGARTASPNDPVDAIFSAARYLRAAGAERSLGAAIFAYNHAGWYVNDVELRARLLQALPANLVDGLTGLMQASFPVAGHLGSDALAAARLVRLAGEPAALISAPARAPVIAPADGTVVAVGENASLGRYVTIVDSYGDRFTLSGLGSLENVIPVLVPRVESAARIARQLGLNVRINRHDLPPASAGTVVPVTSSGVQLLDSYAGAVNTASAEAGGQARATAAATVTAAARTATQPLVKERLFANPTRPASYAAGGSLQLQLRVRSYASVAALKIGKGAQDDIFSRPLALRSGHFTLAPLTVGSIVAAGTILGRVGELPNGTTGLLFRIRPAGARTAVDPRSILAGWELLGRLTEGRAGLGGVGAAAAYDAHNGTIGQLLLSSRSVLSQAVLSDPRVQLDACDRSAIANLHVDRRALAIIEYLSYSGLGPDVSGLACGHAAGTPRQIDISGFDGVSVAGHQKAGGIVDLAIRQLLALEGALRPARVISLLSYPWEAAALSLPDHAAVVEIDLSAGSRRTSRASGSVQAASMWGRLISRLNQVSFAFPAGIGRTL